MTAGDPRRARDKQTRKDNRRKNRQNVHILNLSHRRFS
jgi:hypothetical protein